MKKIFLVFAAVCAIIACDPGHDDIGNAGHITADQLKSMTTISVDKAASGANGNVITCSTSAPVNACWNIGGKDYVGNYAWKKMKVNFNMNGSDSTYPSSVFRNCSSLETIEDVNMNYTSILGTQHGGNGVNSSYWVGVAWELFKSSQKLKNINFTGTVTLYSQVKGLAFFLNCDVSNFTLQTWQSFVDTLPSTSDSHTVRVNKGLAAIPDSIISQITNKGYSLTT
jgi:hypothetical protein